MSDAEHGDPARRALSQQPVEGGLVEIGQFGRLVHWTGEDPATIERHPLRPLERADGPIYLPAGREGAWHLGVEWDWPRPVHEVAIEYADDVPPDRDVRVEYWHGHWPAENRGHWTPIDDPWNGRWVRAHACARREGQIVRYTFDPLDITELPHAADFAVPYRQTLKLRLLFRSGPPAVRRVGIYSDAVWRKVEAEVTLTRAPAGAGPYRAAAHNGLVERLWESEPAGGDGRRVHLVIWYASDQRGEGEQTTAGICPDHAYTGCWPDDRGSPNRTVVTVYGPGADFSFLPGDVAAGKVIDSPTLGVVVRPAGEHAMRQAPAAITSEAHAGTGGRSLYDRVADEEEQTYARAAREMPPLSRAKPQPWGRYVCLGCDANRQEFALRFNGHVYLNKRALKVTGRDTARLLWPGVELRYRFGTGDPPDFREREDATRQRLMDGHLPIVFSEWSDRGIAYEQIAFAALRDEPPWDEPAKRGDEPTVLLLRFTLRNTTPERRIARLWCAVEPGEELRCNAGYIRAIGRFAPDNTVEPGWRFSPYERPRLRAYLRLNGRGEATPLPCPGESGESRARRGAVLYEVTLAGRESHAIELYIPFETYTDPAEEAKVAALDFDAK
ncbi:MAG TPA: hypothetical protein VF234_05695, partial [Limnochordia bacterium]